MCIRDREDEVYRFLDEGIPALLAEGEVYLTDAFRSMQALSLIHI